MLPSEIAAQKRRRAQEARERAEWERKEAMRLFLERRDARRQRLDLAHAAVYDDLVVTADASNKQHHAGNSDGDEEHGAASMATAVETTAATATASSDSIDSLCQRVEQRVAASALALAELRAAQGSSDEELDSEDEGEGEIKRVKSPVLRPQRWLSTVSHARDKIGIPAARVISMGKIVAKEEEALNSVFLHATDKSRSVQ